jgi:hypothetical protein
MPKTPAVDILESRFEKNPRRHEGVSWSEVEARVGSDKAKLMALAEIERTGSEPDVIGRGSIEGSLIFCGCSAETPVGRRGLCYNRSALDSRKEHEPAGCAIETAASMGIERLTEGQYRELQELGEFDLKTSSWVATPADVRDLGGALERLPARAQPLCRRDEGPCQAGSEEWSRSPWRLAHVRESLHKYNGTMLLFRISFAWLISFEFRIFSK